MIWKAILPGRLHGGRAPLVVATAVLVAASAAGCLFPSPNYGTTRNVLTSVAAGPSGAVVAVGWAASGRDRSPVAMNRTTGDGTWRARRVLEFGRLLH